MQLFAHLNARIGDQMFSERIKDFNRMYKLPVASRPTTSELGVTPLQRMTDFSVILGNEMKELDEVIRMQRCLEYKEVFYPDDTKIVAFIPNELDVLTAMGDLLADIQVYCASEMAKYGIPQDDTLQIVMESNFSKMGADGKPIYDANGKVQKGPNYWKPEPRIRGLLEAARMGPGHVAAKLLMAEHVAKISIPKVYGAFDPLPTGDFDKKKEVLMLQTNDTDTGQQIASALNNGAPE